MEEGTCLELALEGERLCKSGDFQGGVAFFEAAVKLGTRDDRTLSAIYSQLGNAYFYLAEYPKANHFHQLDLSLAKSMGDKPGEAKASGNLGNTWKMMGNFHEAAKYCTRHREIAREIGDKIGEGRALYNLANVYHTKAKAMAKLGQQDPGHFPPEIQECLRKAVELYEENLELMTKLGDKSAQGRALGNLGNTYYLLGEFNQAVHYHKQRLEIAREFGDKAGERRAECNLGNANIFLGNFEAAANHYKKTLALAQELSDRVVEAQACYSLGNTYTLLRDYKTAIKYHLRHLQLAQELRDQVGQGRAFWSLANAWTALGNHSEALTYANKHLSVSRQVNDKAGEATAEKSIEELKKMVEDNGGEEMGVVDSASSSTTPSVKRNRRHSMENMEILKLTPGELQDEAASSNLNLHIIQDEQHGAGGGGKMTDVDNFMDILEKFQGKRMDDQRCSMDLVENKENRRPPPKMGLRNRRPGGGGPTLHRSVSQQATGNESLLPINPDLRRSSIPTVKEISNNQSGGGLPQSLSTSSTTSSESCREELFDLIAGLQSRRMDEQRAPLPPPIRRAHAANGPERLPGLYPRDHLHQHNPHHNAPPPPPHQQQAQMRRNNNANSNNNNNNNENDERHNNLGHGRGLHRMATTGTSISSAHRQARQMSLGARVLPDDDFFEMIMRSQSQRLEEQRSALPTLSQANGKSNTGSDKRALERPLTMSSESESPNGTRASTVPDDDFFSLILRFQAGRIEDQRSTLPKDREEKHEEVRKERKGRKESESSCTSTSKQSSSSRDSKNKE